VGDRQAGRSPEANTDVGAMKKERLAAIEKACLMVLAGKLSRSISGRLVSRWGWHIHEHECQ